jgi:hypothetical protein
MSPKETIYLTTDDLMERWKCKRSYVINFMHREGSKAIKIGKRLLVTEAEVKQYEKSKQVKTGS